MRSIDQINVWSPTPEHRTAFAVRSGRALDVKVTAVDSVEAAVADADIIAVATSAQKPVLLGEHVRPGVHVNALGTTHELDESVYLKADQIVASSRELEIEYSNPMVVFQGLSTPPLAAITWPSRLR